MIARCVKCGRLMLIWPWTHYGFWIRADGSEARWHASHDARPRPLPGAQADQIVGFIHVDGTGRGNWSSLDGLSPLEQYQRESR